MILNRLLIWITGLVLIASTEAITGPFIAVGSLEGNRPLREFPGVSWQNSAADRPSKLDNSLWRPLDTLTVIKAPLYAWLRLSVRNDGSRPVHIDFDITRADSISMFVTGKDTSFSVTTGPYVSVRNWQYPENPGVTSLLCQAGAEYEILFRLWSAPERPFSLQSCYIRTRLQTMNQTVAGYRESVGRTEFNGFFLGSVCFALLFSLVVFARTREDVFLYYALYLLGVALYAIIVKTLPYSAIAKAAYLSYPLTYQLGEPVQYLSFAAYVAFGKRLLDIGVQYSLLNRLVNSLIVVLTASGAALLLYNFIDFQYRLQETAFIVSRIVILPSAVILVVWIAVAVKSPIKWFFILGSSLFLLGGVLAVIVDPKTRHLFFEASFFSPVYFFKGGILAETFCFALALGYKLRINQKEKEAVVRSYIDQLEVNRQLIATENLRLEKMVEERTTEIVRKSEELEIQNEKQIKSDFEKQIAELEMKALRSQINPHFIFNSLNSIRYQILKQDYEKASGYLVRFAKLLRKILQSAREHTIPLQEELEMVSLYLELERLRFNDDFSYEVVVDPEIDLDDIRVPPMLIQPYVENSVKHGLINSENPVKILTIDISPVADGFKIEIRDNGIGRKKASLQKSEGASGLGLEITGERIALFNKQYKRSLEAVITDLYRDDKPAGTSVTLFYKW